MPITPDVFPGPAELGDGAARLIADDLLAARQAGRTFVLGCPGGRSASSTYQALAGLVRTERLALDHLVVVMMDDYLVRDRHGALVHESSEAAHSCIRFGREEIVGPLNQAAGAGRGVRPEQLWFPDPADPGRYDDRIADVGGIDVFLLASGSGDGHVAFNTPGAARDSRTRVVDLPDSTRRDNLATFPSFAGDLTQVPRHGVTVGIATIAAGSRSVLMLAHGQEKGRAAAHLLTADAYDATWPATILSECARPRLFLDQAAVTAAAASTH